MDKPLSDATRAKIDALCESIARKEQLGAEVQDELRGHIEDKVVAYLEGKEVVTEADAFVLAREHFGNPAVLATVFSSPACPTPQVSFALTMIGLETVYLFATAFCIFARSSLVWLARFTDNLEESFAIICWPSYLLLNLYPFAVCYAIYAASIGRTGAGNWFRRLSKRSLLLLFVTALACFLIVPEVQFSPAEHLDRNTVQVTHIPAHMTYTRLYWQGILVSAVWCAAVATRHNDLRSLIKATAVWAITACLFNLRSFGTLAFTLGMTWSDLHGTLHGVSMSSWLWDQFIQSLLGAGAAVFEAGMGLFLYIGIGRIYSAHRLATPDARVQAIAR